MGLDLIPKPYPCQKLGVAVLDSSGKIDCQATEACPFRQNQNPHGIFGAECWFRGKCLARELEALGYSGEAEECYASKDSLEAEGFGERLLNLAKHLQKKYQGKKKKPKGAGWSGTWNEKKKDWIWTEYSSFEEAVETIKLGSEWYKKIGELGVSVEPWY